MRGDQIAVSRLPRDPGPAGWNAILPPPGPASPLIGQAEADLVIIGAGFAGLAAARRYLGHRPGARVVVLDASRLADGPAGRNSGFMIDLPHDLSADSYSGDTSGDRVEIEANRAAIDFALEAGRDYGLGAEAISRAGKINAAASRHGLAHNAAYARHLSALGEDHTLLDAAEMQRLTGTDYYHGGLMTPHAAMIQPAMFVRGVAAGLMGAGVAIHENAPVVQLERMGEVWRADTPNGSVTAPVVVLAVNGHAQSFGLYPGRLIHVFTYASMTRALSRDEIARLGGARSWGVTPADPRGTTVRRISGTGGDRIVIRNRFTYDPSLEVSEARIDKVGRTHDKAFAARFPMLTGVDMEHRWGGRLCLSRNAVPAFGEVAPGLISACCQNGLGTAKGTFAGMAAADLAAGVETRARAIMEAAEAPALLPPAPLTWLGAVARIIWSERAAGREL